MPKWLSRRGWWWVAACVLCLAHLGVVQLFLPMSAVLSAEPIAGDDFDTHIGQTYRLVNALASAGQHWGYSPHLLGGFPAGAVFDADNKGCSYFVYVVFKSLNIHPARAFNLFVYLVHAFVPVVPMAAAALFGLAGPVVVLSGALCSLYWFFDSFAHWCFWVGMVSYGFASYFALLPLSLFYRFIAGGRLGWGLICAPVLGLAHLIHPYSFFILAPPMAALYLRRFSSLSRLQHGLVLFIGAVTVAINAPWLWASLTHFHHILNSAFFAQGGLRILVADLFNQLINPTDTGVIGTRASLRFAYGLLAAGTVYGWVKQRDLRVWGLGVAVGTLYFLTYFGTYLPGVPQVQPYRHAVPAGFFASLAAASLIHLAWKAGLPSATAPATRFGLAAVLLLAGQKVCDEVLYFTPHLAPRVEPLLHRQPTALGASGHPPWMHYTLPHSGGIHATTNSMVDWVASNIGPSGRVVVEGFVLGERLAWREATEVIGGFRLRNLEHSLSNILRTHENRVIPQRLLARYVRTYGVTHFIMVQEHPEFDGMPELLEPMGVLFGRRVYRVRIATPKLQGSPGTVAARFNRIAVSGTDEDADITLAYHYHPALRCEPGCQLSQAKVPWPDPVGLIRVPAPHPKDFVIVNRY